MVSDKREVSDFLNLLSAAGITDVVLSPGSRNAPFSISLHGHPRFRVIPVPDERTAGFIALGRAQQTGRPVVLVCTSGTALLNYGPAVAEAFYQRVPLIVASADRPAEWIDHGEGQSIRQSGVLANITRGWADLPESRGAEPQRSANRTAMRRLITLAMGPVPGPVHLNFPLDEPLYRMEEEDQQPGEPYGPVRLPTLHLEACRSDLHQARKVLILAGQLPPDERLTEALNAFAEDTGAAVMSESHSNLSGPYVLSTIDRLISGWSEETRQRYAPDVLITFGHNIISRRVKSWLRASGCAHWRVDEGGVAEDTYRKLKGVLACTPLEWLRAMDGAAQPSPYARALQEENNRVREAARHWITQAPYSDLTAMDVLLRSIPGGWDFQMGNSSVVRYIQLFETRPDIRYYGNRGVSGIDGVTSTAVGAASVSGRPTLLVTGDIAFLYDSNAFWSELRPHNLRIVVINNRGGGIFRIIDGPSTSAALAPYFETTHERSAGEVAGMYRLPFRQVADGAGLRAGLDWLYNREECSVLEICTPREENDRILKDYFRELKKYQP